MKQVLQPTTVLALAILANTAQAQDDSTLSTVVVTGNRGAEQRTVTSSPVPIDVVSVRQLQSTGKPGLMEALSAVIPSLTLPEKTGWDASGIARAPNLRGLSAAEVLVLVNGKRRHTAATLNINGINTGAAPADLDLIPISAIDHVEVLRDGAAAQYGSDAIAGVINVILKADTSGTSVTNAGLGYDGKKQTVQQSLNKGFEIGNGGIVQLALDARSQNDDNKASANGYTYAQAYEQAGRATYGGYGTPKTNLLTLGYNAELPIDDSFSLYSFTTYSRRKAEQGQNFRLPTITNTITTGPNGYPGGYTPTWYIDEDDFQAAFGGKGTVGAWDWDLSTTYGRNEAEQGTTHNQNPSLGEATPNSFTSGTWISTELTTNLDFKRGFDVGLQKPLDLSYGFEHRRDTYEVQAGDSRPMPMAATAWRRAIARRPGPRSPTAFRRKKRAAPRATAWPVTWMWASTRCRTGTWAPRFATNTTTRASAPPAAQADHPLRLHPAICRARYRQQWLPCAVPGQQPVQCALHHLWRGERGVSVDQLRGAAGGFGGRQSAGRRGTQARALDQLQPGFDPHAHRPPELHRRCLRDQPA
ncbi:TonB-dependent siderophore receptor [Pseudomonas fluorescens WH6]|nr:TonB-dependent siderophore receptor [Pseudomonas fluorescens WH6]